MRFPTVTRLVLAAALLSGGAALARREVKDFQAPREQTPEEIEAAKARARNGNMAAYGKDVQIKEKPVPWNAIGIAGLVFLVATPFAVRVYRDTTKEIADANTFGVSKARAGEDD